MSETKSLNQILKEIEDEHAPKPDPQIQRLDKLLAHLDAELESIGRAQLRERVQQNF
jgi:hypothetical protein